MHPDLTRLGSRLSVELSAQEVHTFLEFCHGQGYEDNDAIKDDVIDSNAEESFIVDHMKEQYDWNVSKQAQFIKQVREALDNPNIGYNNNQNQPIMDISYDNDNDDQFPTPQPQTKSISKFKPNHS
eukprot:267754_1